MKNITVVGAGIIGLSTAYIAAKRYPDTYLTVYAEHFGKGRVSEDGFGLIVNRSKNSTDNDDVTENVMMTNKHLSEMHPTTAEFAGIRRKDVWFIINARSSSELHEKLKSYTLTVEGVQKMTYEELVKKGVFPVQQNENLKLVYKGEYFSEDTLHGFKGTIFIVNTNIYLKWLKTELEAMQNREGEKRVKFIHSRLENFDGVAKSCDLVLNCCGLGARALCNDPNMFPIRGQYLILDAPEIEAAAIAGDTLICPRKGEVRIGSVYQRGRSDVAVDPKDTVDILRRNEALYPGLQNLKIKSVQVGIRPGRRNGARVEIEWVRRTNGGNDVLPVIHNYGHSGKGIAQHWGTSRRAVDLIKIALGKGSANL